MISLILYRKMSDEEKLKLNNEIFHHLCWHVSNGWRISVSEKKTSKELNVSYAIVSTVASTKKFREFYNSKAYSPIRKNYGIFFQ